MAENLDFFNNKLNVDSLVINRAKNVANSATSIRDLVQVIKSIELLGIDDGVNDAVLARIMQLDSSSFTTEDLIFIARMQNFSLISESDDDSNNVNHLGEIIIGERTLEVFGENTLETYYAVA